MRPRRQRNWASRGQRKRWRRAALVLEAEDAGGGLDDGEDEAGPGDAGATTRSTDAAGALVHLAWMERKGGRGDASVAAQHGRNQWARRRSASRIRVTGRRARVMPVRIHGGGTPSSGHGEVPVRPEEREAAR